MEEGAVEEVEAILALQLAPEMPAMKAIGVSQIADMLAGLSDRRIQHGRVLVAERPIVPIGAIDRKGNQQLAHRVCQFRMLDIRRNGACQSCQSADFAFEVALDHEVLGSAQIFLEVGRLSVNEAVFLLQIPQAIAIDEQVRHC